LKQFQVASYALFLKYIIQDIRGLDIDTSGGVWLSSEPEEPRLFRLDFLYLKIEQFYTCELPAILKEKPVSWLFNNKCHGCTFVDKCRREARGTPGQIPYMTEMKVEEARQKGDIEDLGARLQGLSLHNFNPVGFKLPKPFEISYKQDEAVVNSTSNSASVFILPLSFES
jgi:hypothetical protein